MPGCFPGVPRRASGHLCALLLTGGLVALGCCGSLAVEALGQPLPAEPIQLADGEVQPSLAQISEGNGTGGAGETSQSRDPASQTPQEPAKNPTAPRPDDYRLPVATGNQSPAAGESRPQPAPSSVAAPSPSPVAQPGVLPVPTINMTSYFKVLGGLCVILALVFGGLYLLRKIAPRAGFGGVKGRQLTLESVLSLGPRKSVMVVRFLNKQLVLGVTDSRITCLHIQEEDHEPDDAASNASSGDVLRNFADRLKDHL